MNNLVEIFSNPSYLDYEEYPEFMEWYSLEGNVQIIELSRQLRTYLNYRSSLIRGNLFNFQKKNIDYKNEKLMKHKEDLISLSSRYVALLNNEIIEKKNIKKKLLYLIEKVKKHLNNYDINLLKEIKVLNQKLWIILHLLSEYDLSHHPDLLKLIIKIAGICSSAASVFYYALSHFYEEIARNYQQMEEELVQTSQEENFTPKKMKEEPILK